MQTSLTFSQFLSILRQRWRWIIYLTTGIVGFTVFFTYYVVKPVYSNSSTLLVTQQNADVLTPLTFDEILLNEKLLGTYKEIIYSRRILQPIADQHHLSIQQIRESLSVSVNSNSQVLTLKVQHRQYQLATDLVNEISDRIALTLKELIPIDNIAILDPAILDPTPTPIKPNKKLNVMLSLILAILLSITTALLRHFMDTRVRETEDVANLLGYPVIGSIPSYPQQDKGRPLL